MGRRRRAALALDGPEILDEFVDSYLDDLFLHGLVFLFAPDVAPDGHLTGAVGCYLFTPVNGLINHFDWKGAVYSVKPRSTWTWFSFSVMSLKVKESCGIGFPVSTQAIATAGMR